jgi:hypothetical protein
MASSVIRLFRRLEKKIQKKTMDLFCEVKQINEKYKPTYNSANGGNTSDRSLARIPQIEDCSY